MCSPKPRIDFPAIQFQPENAFTAIHRFYLLLEPDLVAAIQRGETSEARRLINHVLVHIYSLGEAGSDFLRFLLLEFVVILTRRAIELGGDSQAILSFGFSAVRQLGQATDEEELAAWLRNTLDGLIAAFPRFPTLPPTVERTLEYLRRHLSSPLRRHEVAKACGVSDSHLNTLCKQSLGRSFRELLRQLRVERAAELLADPRLELADIAAACGFCDQSHLSRIFRQVRGLTPRQFRTRLSSISSS